MAEERKSLMRCLGEFTGHIVRGIRTPASGPRQEVGRSIEERTEGGVTLRRTTIDEIELPAGSDSDKSHDTPANNGTEDA